MTPKKKLLIIGAGPGGYTAAFAAAKAGLNVTLVDSQTNLGGICLNAGCIPSKALLHCAKILKSGESAKQFGITFDSPSIDIDQTRKWKNSIVERLGAGITFLSKKLQVHLIQAQAKLTGANSATLIKPDGESENIQFDYAIIATGSSPVQLKNQPACEHILSSTEALQLNSIPKTMLVVGGGYIGLEMATIYAAFGAEVSLVEAMPSLLAGVDKDCLRILNRSLKKKLYKIMLSSNIQEMKPTDNGVAIIIKDRKGEQIEESFEKVLVAVGRRPNTKEIGLDRTRITCDEKGFISVKPNRQTDEPSVYAIGDVTSGPMLAHKASAEAHVAVDAILGKETAFAPQTIPAVIYTDPEIATCGINEEQAQSEGREIKVASFNWTASGRALTMNRTDGITKVICDARNGKILGMAIAGPDAGELIAEGVLAVENGLTVDQLKKTIHPHPTLSETIIDALFGSP